MYGREVDIMAQKVAIKAECGIGRQEKGALGMGERWVFIFDEGPPYGSDLCILQLSSFYTQKVFSLFNPSCACQPLCCLRLLAILLDKEHVVYYLANLFPHYTSCLLRLLINTSHKSLYLTENVIPRPYSSLHVLYV